MSITVDRFVCADTKLIINTDKPGKPPLEFDIGDLRMKDIGPGQPLRFDATLVNPKPVGNIKSTGVFGPLNEENPRDSAVGGDYSFTQADLGTIKGIGGILSSTGKYAGTLGRIEVEGQTDSRSEEHTSELQSLRHLVCRLLLGYEEHTSESSHLGISYAVFCLETKRTHHH